MIHLCKGGGVRDIVTFMLTGSVMWSFMSVSNDMLINVCNNHVHYDSNAHIYYVLIDQYSYAIRLINVYSLYGNVILLCVFIASKSV